MSATSEAASRVLSYQANHRMFGDIGTYTNVIEPHGTDIVVTTDVTLRVSMGFITMYQEDGKRIETWRDGRLIAFAGTTTTNGYVTKIDGEARADGFAVTVNGNTVLAPKTVKPSNPWSHAFIGCDSLLLADSGEIRRIVVSGPKTATIAVGGAAVEAREYEIPGVPAFKIWLDAENVPVMFSAEDIRGLVTFRLIKHA